MNKLVEIESIAIRAQDYIHVFLRNSITVIKSPQCSHCLSMFFILMVLIMLIQTCDMKVDSSEKSDKKNSSKATYDPSFSSPPPKQVSLIISSLLFLFSLYNSLRDISRNKSLNTWFLEVMHFSLIVLPPAPPTPRLVPSLQTPITKPLRPTRLRTTTTMTTTVMI